MALSLETKNALRAGIAVGTATAAYGFSFGALSVAAGLSVWQTCVLSLFMFSGGSQFAVVGILASGGVSAGPAAIATSTFLGLRNGIYSLRMAPLLRGGWLTRIAAAQLTIDESTAVALNQKALHAQRVGFWATGIAVYVGWNLTTLLGALVGNLLGDVSKLGLDAVAAAAFVGLLWPRLRQLQASVVAGVAAVIATILIPLSPPGIPVLAAAVVAVIVGLTNWFHRPDAINQPDDSTDPGDVMGMHLSEGKQ
ncbi:AzlC family ABC transporter permease [Alpinimonas psychrophila]|uniref:Putative branched-subunit amino acid permease n=1 Tax=Alpinimonas psychrophila TaxID=748908 RepID=A0A7W3JSU7_9MICO|nr:AzlC family ABC transporter permease [Alpinimonas psychrophila]MBA8828608.1 putative branched-subunit amino acid permease [Alpinimonas psychrophila]